jgi:soluble lytic murein transglycosylase
MTLPSLPEISDQMKTLYQEDELVKVSKLLSEHGKTNEGLLFAKTVINNNVGNVSAIGSIVYLLQNPKNITYNLELGKVSSQNGYFVPEITYPVPYKKFAQTIDPALTYAIMSRESLFNEKATSHANAYGLMQLILPTCQLEDTKCTVKKLLTDPKYNIRIGNQYLKSLLKKYDGSILLAVAAYNAGPIVVDKWIVTNGDPRTFKNLRHILYWIESIPYYETRDYVQRVLENIQVYRQVLHKSKELKLMSDLHAK